MDTGLFAENVRRAAGAHLVTLDALAQHVGMTRPGLMKLLTEDASKRTQPRAETAVKIADAFGVEVRHLFEEPQVCLDAVVDAFPHAPIRQVAKVPASGSAKKTSAVVPMRRARKAR